MANRKKISGYCIYCGTEITNMDDARPVVDEQYSNTGEIECNKCWQGFLDETEKDPENNPTDLVISK